MEIFNSVLKEDDILPISTWASNVTDSTTAPFSDKLMMFHITTMNQAGIGNYGNSISLSSRKDLVTEYTRLIGEIAQYTEDGANIMINHGWMEQPPKAPDRNKLAKT